MAMPKGSLFACVAAAALFGVSSPASKALLGGLTPLTLAGLLYLGAAIGVLPFAMRTLCRGFGGAIHCRGFGGANARAMSHGARDGARFARTASRANLARLAGVVVFGGVLGPALLLLGLSLAPAASVSLWLNFEAPATALLGWLFFKEHLDARIVTAVVLVTGASALLAGASGAALVPAALLVAGACVCWGLDNNLSSMIDGFTPAQSTLAKGLAAGTVNLALGLAIERPTLDVAHVGGALVLGAFAYGASIVLYVRAAQQLGAVRSQLVFSSAPFIGVGVSWAALGEPVLASQLVAGGVMLVALALLHRERHGHAHAHDATKHTHWHVHDDDHHDHAHEPAVHGGHVHEHEHVAVRHEHAHRPDVHHRHRH